MLSAPQNRFIGILVALLLTVNPTTAMAKSSTFRVVSYNVLSSHLASPSHFSTLDPQHLDSTIRLPKILDKLAKEISSHKEPTIFCLQEVSYQWAGKFHAFFANKGFHVVTGLYGKPFNGYMGQLTAYPTEQLETLDVDINRLSDTVEWPEPMDQESLLSSIYHNAIRKPLQWVGLAKETPESHWSIAKRRFNVLLTATLREKQSGIEFCVANYHMPCVFYVPMVMTMHADMCVAHVQKLAEGRPYIVAGDFNIKPKESVYRYLTTGHMPTTDAFYPTPFHNNPEQPWKPRMIEAVRSAYSVCNDGVEPDFTNYARVGENDPFIDTLDYIFVSDKVRPQSVHKLPAREEAGGPFPNEMEPSDHILIACAMKIDQV